MILTDSTVGPTGLMVLRFGGIVLILLLNTLCPKRRIFNFSGLANLWVIRYEPDLLLSLGIYRAGYMARPSSQVHFGQI